MAGPRPVHRRIIAAGAALIAAGGALAAAAFVFSAQAYAAPSNRLALETAGWEFITLSDDTIVYMKDAGRAGANLRVWTAYDSLKPRDRDGFSFHSVQSLGEYDCAQRKSRVMRETFYAAPNLKGETWSMPNFQVTDWAPAKPGSVGDLRLEFACRARPQA